MFTKSGHFLLTGRQQDHWQPIDRFCSPCSKDYTHVLKYENLECELDELSKSLNSDKLNNAIKESGSIKTEQTFSKSEFFNLYGGLSDHQLDSFYNWYEEDCELFGYDCQQTLCQIKRWKSVNL